MRRMASSIERAEVVPTAMRAPASGFISSAKALVDHIRGMDPWPNAFTSHDGQPLKVFRATLSEHERGDAGAGVVVAADGQGVHVATGDGVVCLGDVQPAGKRRMAASAWATGRKIGAGVQLG